VRSGSRDLLLYTITAAREMDWATFKRVYTALHLREYAESQEEPTGYSRSRSLRMLDSLGHVDVQFDLSGGRLFVARASLVRLPIVGRSKAVLCGARGPQTVADLKQASAAVNGIIGVDVVAQESGPRFVPDQVTVTAESPVSLSNLATALGILYVDPPPGLGILEFSASLQEYLDSCRWSASSELNWPRKDFDPAYLQFRWRYTSKAGARLSRYEDPIRQVPLYRLWQSDVNAQVDLNWGRYAILQSDRVPVLLYNPDKYLLGIPASASLPRLLSRALVLCSGKESRQVVSVSPKADTARHWTYDVYSQISHALARVLAQKLGQTLTTTNLDTQDTEESRD
jgi:hypothetical protein